MTVNAPDKASRPAAAAYQGAAALPPWLRHVLRTGLHLLFDGVAIALSYAVAYALRFHSTWWLSRFPLTGTAPEWASYEKMLYAAVPLWLMIFGYSSKLYSDPWMGSTDRFLKILKGCVLGTALTLAATYIYSRLEYSRMMLLLILPISTVLVTASQAAVLWVDEWMSRHEAARPVLIVGGKLVAEELKLRIRSRHPEASIDEVRELPSAGQLEEILGRKPYFELILLTSSLPHDRILAAAEVCDARGVAFKMVPDLLELRLGEVQMDHSLGLPAYRIQHGSMTRINFAVKRAFDLAFSTSLLAFTAAPMALVCLLIKLDSKGPVLYRQRRYGHKGRIFEAFKFRTMVDGAERQIQAVKGLNDHPGAFFKSKKDPRVTTVGKWLRHFSLDEFPQFLNVLRGEMSVVGPRPLALTTGELESLQRDFGPTAKKRMNILPGITGLWQVSGRSDVSSEQRFGLDLFYVEHWSLGLDLEIILKTIPAMLFGKGAY
ncbi:MAG: sugar transferase [Elusimicrobia bacterium]|nr:sugar transferase [Elusimicrobiota bacterium]